MRRTQARQVELAADRLLSEQPCRRCGVLGVTIVGLGANGSGAIELGWCKPACAMIDGWPWLQSERQADAGSRQVDLFGLRL